jgi:DNA-binding transcriptional regulator YhcF (GntR family)
MTTDAIDLKQGQPFPKLNHGIPPVFPVAVHLEQLLKQHLIAQSDVASLPSLMELARFYGVSQMDIHDAFQVLRRKGYDYLLAGMDVRITFWLSRQPQEDRPRPVQSRAQR